ncbi:MAG TPA: branched-chain amino acid ABC transporter substrate-binding protein [Chloroflexi bacterium]|jgi:branched-chain amino acid transport system substrate-binding protein|nr:branched-chain amino acid ABC transporter substrate-binding protein [Chloroflexota bacterium]
MVRDVAHPLRTITIAIVIVALIACGARPTKGDLTVYVAAPLSGWQADGGQTVVGGVRLAAETINDRGGLLGYRVNVVALDDEADSEVAVEVANEVAAAVQRGEPVLGVIGHYNSGQAAAALPIYRDLPIIVITPTASDPALTAQGYSNFFRVNATDAAQGPHDARFLVNELGAQRIVVVHADNDYGRGLQQEIVRALDELGRPPVAVIEIEEAAVSYADVIPTIRDAAPDAVFLAGYETEGYVLLPELRDAGIDVPFMASDGCFLYEFIDGSGPAAEGAYVSAITPDPKVVANEQWWRAYQEVEARNPGTYSIAGYSAMMVLAEGVRRAESLDTSAISQALKQGEVTTLVGAITYDERGDLENQQVYIFEVRDGEFEQWTEAAE